MTVRVAVHVMPALRVMSTSQRGDAPVVIWKVVPAAGAGGGRPGQSRTQARVQLSGLAGQVVPAALSCRLSPAVMLAVPLGDSTGLGMKAVSTLATWRRGTPG